MAPHTVEQHENLPVEADHGRLKARLRPMRGVKRHSSTQILAAGHAYVQNLHPLSNASPLRSANSRSACNGKRNGRLP